MPSFALSRQQQEKQQVEISIRPSPISVTFALWDEIHLNDIDTAFLVSHVRKHANMRPNLYVFATAKKLSSVCRWQ